MSASSTAAGQDARGGRSIPWSGPIFSLAVSAAMLLALWLGLPRIEAALLGDKVAWPVARILLLVGAGLVVGQTIEATGWTRHLAWVASPMFRFSRLGQRCSAAFTSAFFSGVASNSMLVDYYREEKIGKRQLFLANLVNHFPVFFLHLPTTLFIVLPLAGWAGGIYLVLVLLALLLRTSFFLVLGRFLLPPPREPEVDGTSGNGSSGRPPFRQIAAQVRDKVPPRFVQIMQYVIPIYILVFGLNQMGAFDFMREALSQAGVGQVMPVESLSMVVVAFLADYSTGFATAGALLDNQVLGLHQAVIALLLGNIIAFPVRSLRHQLPRYLGIFSPKLGTQLLLLGQLARIASLALVGVLYAVFVLV